MNPRVQPAAEAAKPHGGPHIGSPCVEAAGADTWPGRMTGHVRTAVLTVAGMPRRVRPAVEHAMARCIRSESEFIVPGDDPLTAQWCTRWHRDAVWDAVVGAFISAPGIGCHQVITGTPEELEAFERALGVLAAEYGFQASVDSVR